MTTPYRLMQKYHTNHSKYNEGTKQIPAMTYYLLLKKKIIFLSYISIS